MNLDAEAIVEPPEGLRFEARTRADEPGQPAGQPPAGTFATK